jgi:gliding motility-associated-like protein
MLRDTALCATDKVRLTANVANGTGVLSYLWSPAPAIIGAIDQPTIMADASKALSFVITVRDSLPGLCAVEVKDTVNIRLLNIEGLNAYSDTVICQGDSAVLRAEGGVSFEWSPNDRISTTSGNMVYVFPDRDAVYYVRISSSEGCIITRKVQVGVYELEAEAGPDRYIKTGERIKLEGSGGSSYYWRPGHGLSSQNVASPLASPDKTISYILTVRDASGCESVDSVTVNVVGDVYFPGAFTPNGDGLNDLFGLLPRDAVGVKLLEFGVHNRWGERVFVGYRLSDRWDGTYKGRPCELGTYYYHCIYSVGSRSYMLKGDVTLVR